MRIGVADDRGTSRPPPGYATRWAPTEEEKVERYNALAFHSGTYEILDGLLVTRPLVAKVADFSGGEARYQHRISGDTLWMSMVEEVSFDGIPAPSSRPGSSWATLVRIE